MKERLPLLAAVAAATLTIGCEYDNSDLRRYSDQVKARGSYLIEPLPELPQPELVSREIARNPFALPQTGTDRK